jgi:phosphoenolpyruvate carboxykinase (ATP)
MKTAMHPIDLDRAALVHYNPSVEDLIRRCLDEDNCKPASNGAVVAYTGKYTGRTPKDKHIVKEPSSQDNIWWGNNNSMSPEVYAALAEKAREYAVGKTLYVIDAFAGWDPQYRIAVRIIVERAYHALFIKQLLIRPTAEELKCFQPDWTVVDVGRMKTDPAVDHVKGDATIALNLADRQVLVCGTEYAGEIKKSVFTIMNYLLPLKGVLSMHCSANIGSQGDTALFFGLSGTGKTTLSADPERDLIGDDEHAWTDEGVFNIEGGCYAKCIKLSQKGEPVIWDAIRRGSVLENVVLRPDGTPDYDDESLTENTRCAYPVEFVSNARIPCVGGQPQNVIFLTCDALGVLPPLSRLSREQAMSYFLNGYTARVAGTEAGVTEPTVTFSTCFGAPFLPLHPRVYADLLGKKLDDHGSVVWLVNTGWTGGPAGVGHRISLEDTRALLHAALDGKLADVPFENEAAFGLNIPTACPGLKGNILRPRETWPDPVAYDAKAAQLKAMFDANIAKFA